MLETKFLRKVTLGFFMHYDWLKNLRIQSNCLKNSHSIIITLIFLGLGVADTIKKISCVNLRFSDWLFELFEPIRTLKTWVT